MTGDPQNKRKIAAQAAAELAIFGAILLFLIGGIIRVGFQQGQSMDISLRVFRMALGESWRTAQGKYHQTGYYSIARNNSSVFLLEDRLSVDAGQKFGTRDRSPFIASGAGTFSQTLLYSFDWNSVVDVPVTDFFINGQRFPLTVAAFVTESGDELSADQTKSGIPFCHTAGATVFSNNTGKARCIEPRCYSVSGSWYPCVIFFRKVYNCSTCGFSKIDAADTQHAYYFDLNFDGTPEFSNSALPAGWASSFGNLVGQFAWQWRGVMGINTKISSSQINSILAGMERLSSIEERATINLD